MSDNLDIPIQYMDDYYNNYTKSEYKLEITKNVPDLLDTYRLDSGGNLVDRSAPNPKAMEVIAQLLMSDDRVDQELGQYLMDLYCATGDLPAVRPAITPREEMRKPEPKPVAPRRGRRLLF